MDRRAFLGSLGAGGLVGVVASSTATSAARRNPVINTYVTNVRQWGGERPLPKVGQAIHVVRDTDRAYDPHALAVTNEAGDLLGYIPPIHSQVIEPMISSGYVVHGWVEASQIKPRPQIRLALTVQPSLHG